MLILKNKKKWEKSNFLKTLQLLSVGIGGNATFRKSCNPTLMEMGGNATFKKNGVTVKTGLCATFRKCCTSMETGKTHQSENSATLSVDMGESATFRNPCN